MRTILLGLLLLWSGVVCADEVTIDFTSMEMANATVMGTVTEGGVSLTFDIGDGGTAPTYYFIGTAVRFYSLNTLTVEASEGVITSIVFNTASDYAMSSDNVKSDCGQLDYKKQAWTGESQTVVFTNGAARGNVRILSMTITTSGEGGGESGEEGEGEEGEDDEDDDEPKGEEVIVRDPTLGTPVVVVAQTASGEYYAMANTLNDNKKLSALTAPVNADGTVDIDELKASVVWYYDEEAGTLCTSERLYLGYSSGTNLSIGASAYEWTVSENGLLTIAEGDKGLIYRSTSKEFGCYATSNLENHPEIYASSSPATCPVTENGLTVVRISGGAEEAYDLSGRKAGGCGLRIVSGKKIFTGF